MASLRYMILFVQCTQRLFFQFSRSCWTSWRTSCCCWTRWTGRRTLPSWTTSPWMRTATILAFRWHSDILMNDAGKAAIIGLRSLPQVVQFSSFRWSAEHISWTFPSNYQPWKLNLGEKRKVTRRCHRLLGKTAHIWKWARNPPLDHPLKIHITKFIQGNLSGPCGLTITNDSLQIAQVPFCQFSSSSFLMDKT